MIGNKSMHSKDELTPSVIIADPRLFMRGCLACWLNEIGRGFQPFVAADAVQAVKESDPPTPRAVILSASSCPAGRAWLKEQAAGLRHAAPDAPVVLIRDESDMAAGQELALSLGCQAFIPMSSSLEVAFAALQLVFAGGRYFPNFVAAGLSRVIARGGLPQPRAPRRSDLTPREQAVCELLSEGLPNKLIGRKLGMSVSTVKIHVHHILEKLNVSNRTEVAIRISADTPSIALESAKPPPRMPGEIIDHEVA
jgi:DNA-binding NarL/FixJ family response regulator